MSLKILEFKEHKLVNNRPRLFSDLPFYENILLLQGPVGPFFDKLKNFFLKKGSKVFKIHFNYGDYIFYKSSSYIFYQDLPIEWRDYISKFYKKRNIKAIFLMGDKRFYHNIAIEVAKSLGIHVYVFEEGYIRPNYFTLENDGANMESNLSKLDPNNLTPLNLHYVEKEYSSFVIMCLYGIKYWFYSVLYRHKIKNYIHHKKLNFKKALTWILGFFRYLFYYLSEFNIRKQLLNNDIKKFLCILQVHDDFQVTHNNTDFKDIETFIEYVIYNFYQYTRQHISDDILLIKHHPMDIGEKNYSKLINKITKKLKIDNKRIIYIHNFKIDKILNNIKGSIMINSTLGLKFLRNRIPVINLSNSFYDKNGLTFQGTLKDFFENPIKPNIHIVNNYISHVISKSQVNGTLYAINYKIE